MNIVVFYLINSILKREMELRENKIFLERVKNETEMYRSISENYDKQRKREHEYQNHMQVISDLLKNKKYQELERFIDESNSDTAGKIDKIDTNHVIVNSILKTKYREAREKKIVFERIKTMSSSFIFNVERSFTFTTNTIFFSLASRYFVFKIEFTIT